MVDDDVRAACVAVFFVPLMAVGPGAVLAAHNEALLYQALSAAGMALGEENNIVVLYTYTYDANGNTLSKSDGTSTNTYVYDFENRLLLAEVGIPDGSNPPHAVTYAYDADGVRKSKSTDGVFTEYLTDKNRPFAQVLEERDGDTDVLQVRYTYGDDLISQTRGPDPLTDIWYYHYDGQMSTRQLTNGSAAVTDTYTYDAFGNLLTPMGPTPNNYLYTGEQYDPNVGFYYLRARYYNQAVGRFINRDPFGGSVWAPVSLHKYAYVGADPVNKLDPSGLFSIPQVSIASAIGLMIVALGFHLVTPRNRGRTVSIRISIDPRNKPAYWDTPTIQQYVRTHMATCFSGNVNIVVFESMYPLGKGGWSRIGDVPFAYDHVIKFDNNEFGGRNTYLLEVVLSPRWGLGCCWLAVLWRLAPLATDLGPSVAGRTGRACR